MTTIDTDLIRERVDLIDLAGRTVQLRKAAADEWAGPCPKCGGVDRLHVKRDWFFCRQCYPPDAPGVGHDAIGWLRWLDGLDFRTACERLATGVAPVTTTPRRAPERVRRAPAWGDPAWQDAVQRDLRQAQDRLWGAEGAEARGYLLSRGLESDTWRAWGLGYAMTYHTHLQSACPAIWLPWQGKGKVKAVQYRFFGDGIAHSDRFAQRAGGERTLYGVDLLGQHGDTLLLVEGEINALSVWQAHLDGLDVVSFGSESQAASDMAARLAVRYRRVTVWADDPDATQAAMAAIPGAHGLRSVVQDGQKLDANALLQAGALADFLQAAICAPDDATTMLAMLGDARAALCDRLAYGRDWLREQETAGRMETDDYASVFTAWRGLLDGYEHNNTQTETA